MADSRTSAERRTVQMTLAKPLGIQLARGLDSAAYVIKSDSDIGNTDQRIQVRLPATLLFALSLQG